jgi:hypothetical protein
MWGGVSPVRAGPRSWVDSVQRGSRVERCGVSPGSWWLNPRVDTEEIYGQVSPGWCVPGRMDLNQDSCMARFNTGVISFV